MIDRPDGLSCSTLTTMMVLRAYQVVFSILSRAMAAAVFDIAGM